MWWDDIWILFFTYSTIFILYTQESHTLYTFYFIDPGKKEMMSGDSRYTMMMSGKVKIWKSTQSHRLLPDRKSMQNHIQRANFVVNCMVNCFKTAHTDSRVHWTMGGNWMMVFFSLYLVHWCRITEWWWWDNSTDRRQQIRGTTGTRTNDSKNPTRIDWLRVD